MFKFHETEEFEYTIWQIYRLITDIEQYPSFVPWMDSVKIIQKNHFDDKKERKMQEYDIMASVVVKLGPVMEKYNSLIFLEKPTISKVIEYQNSYGKKEIALEMSAKVIVDMIEGRFNKGQSIWEIHSKFYNVSFKNTKYKPKIGDLLDEVILKPICDENTIKTEEIYDAEYDGHQISDDEISNDERSNYERSNYEKQNIPLTIIQNDKNTDILEYSYFSYNSCKTVVNLILTFEFQNKLLEQTSKFWLAKAPAIIRKAFCKAADELYGKNKCEYL